MRKFWIIELVAMAIFVPSAIYLKIAGDNGWMPASQAETILTIAGIVFALIVSVSAISMFIPSMSSFFANTFLGGGRDAKRILATGRPATATVLALDESSQGGVTTINDQPYLNLKLKIDDGQA
ncbi:MAG: hypothetical protein PHH60_04425, partial [Candidatus Margulisbacteria bacterium]|nr:hypothetical protein [Candidatus Margulisiibacteriota bacterium]